MTNNCKHLNMGLKQEYRFPDLKTAVIRFVDSGRVNQDGWELYDDNDTHILNDDALWLYDFYKSQG